MARTSSEQWAKYVERWKDSGLTAKEFAAEAGVKASSLSYWRWKLSAATRGRSDTESEVLPAPPEPTVPAKRRNKVPAVGPSAGFVELPVATLASAPAVLELLLGEVRVRVPAGFDEATLTRLVRAVEAAR